jgi:hypothetical protein
LEDEGMNINERGKEGGKNKPTCYYLSQINTINILA